MKFKVQGRSLMLTQASHTEMKTLEYFLTRKADNYRFHPLYKKGHWDGNISFFKAKRYIPSGLWKEILQLCKDNNFPFDIEKEGFNQLFETKIKETDFKSWVARKFQGEKKPRPYQVESAWKIIKGKACIAELATSAGKSFIIFIIIAFLFEKGYESKFLMIVPTIQLVLQAISDFEDYKTWASEPIDFDFKFQGIHSGMKIKPGVNVVVGTYQTLVKKKKKFFEEFGIVGCDEAHTAKAVSIQKILEKCSAERRFGVTGTIPKPDSIGRLNVMSNLGPVVYVLKAKDLIEQNYITNVNIRCLRLNYTTEDFRHALHNVSKHQDGRFMLEKEKSIVINSEKRLDFIIKLLNKIDQNTLVLFSRIEYGNKLFNAIKDRLMDREILYVDGSVDKELREEVRADMEKDCYKDIKYTEFDFGDYKIEVKSNSEVLLSNGTKKLAKDITEHDDIAISFIEKFKS